MKINKKNRKIRKISLKSIIISTLLLALFVLAIWSRTTYKNVLKSKDYMNSFVIPADTDDAAFRDFQNMKTSLDTANIILKVKSTGEKRFRFRTCEELVRVEKVFKGNQIHKGSSIYLYEVGTLFAFKKEDGVEADLANIYYRNWLKKGDEYLVFLDGKMDQLTRSKYPTYKFTEKTMIEPAFSYHPDRYAKTPLPIGKYQATFVDYEKAKDNEFFLTSQAAYAKLQELEEILFAKYPSAG